MEIIGSKSLDGEFSEGNIEQNNIQNKINNFEEEEDEEEFNNNLNEMEMNGFNEINELDEEDEESENQLNNDDNNEENYGENEISNSVENVENNTINTIDEENDENSNNNNNSYYNEYKEIKTPFILPLIILENDKYIINPQVKQIFLQIGNNKSSIISLFSNDKYFEEKYNILNKLMSNNLNNNNYSKFSNKNNIILYSKPLIIKNNDNNGEELSCFIIDIFNLDITEDNNKTFLIMILISSILIFISRDIDDDSFNNFNFILKVIKTIKIRNISEEENINELSKFLPNLIWILLNNNIKMEDKNGNTITEKQYMENCLNIIDSNNEDIEEKNRIKEWIKKYFKERECLFSMKNQNIFNNDFNDKNMKIKIIKKIKPKYLFGQLLTGNMIIELIESILYNINSGGITIIYNLWKYIIKKEFLKYANNLIYNFSSELKEFRNEKINSNQFYNENLIEVHKSKLLEKYMKEYLASKAINEEIKLEYKEKVRNKLEIELNKYSKENEKYFEDKFIKDLNLLSNKFMENLTSSDIYEKNSYKFFQDFEDFREKAVQKTPDFPHKNEILFNKILLIIKKFINGKIMKIKVINEEKNYLETENKNRSNKINELNKELNMLKSKNYEYLQKISNEIKLEKKKNKRTEERMNRLINNKTKEIDNLNKQIELESSNYEKKIKALVESNKNLDKEIKMKDEQIIVMKMNNDKVSSLYGQKSNYLEREINNWKDKYNLVIKEAMNKQNELYKENFKLKEQNKTLMKKENKTKELEIIKSKNNSNNLNNNSFKNKNGRNGINGLITYIKRNFKDKKSKMIKLDKYFLNKKKQNQEKLDEKLQETKDIKKEQKNNQIINKENNDNFIANKKNISKFDNGINTNNIGNNNNFIFTENKYSNKTESLRKIKNYSINVINNGTESTYNTNTAIINNSISNINENNKEYTPEKLKIKIIKGRIRKDKNGKPYLEYIININYDNMKNWNINRRFNQFTSLYKTLRIISQDNFELPKSSNIFSNITALFSGLSHENKIIQLEKFLKDLTEMPELNNSKHLYFFLELNHLYE